MNRVVTEDGSMASYRGHLSFSTSLGALYAGLAWWELGYDPATAVVAGGLTALGGLLPDLDSASGKPIRELFGLAAALIPWLLLRRMVRLGLTAEEVLCVLAGSYLFIRFGLSALFKKITVHRGMFHSIPAMLISGLVIFLSYHHPLMSHRLLLTIGVMVGFFSHLLLDELCSVDFRGLTPTLNQFAGTAVKFYSKSLPATMMTYTILVGLSYLTYGQIETFRSGADNEPEFVLRGSETRIPLKDQMRQRRQMTNRSSGTTPATDPSRMPPTASMPPQTTPSPEPAAPEPTETPDAKKWEWKPVSQSR